MLDLANAGLRAPVRARGFDLENSDQRRLENTLGPTVRPVTLPRGSQNVVVLPVVVDVPSELPRES